MITKIPTEALNILWQEGFFALSKGRTEIEVRLSKMGNNFSDTTLINALRRAKFINRTGKPGQYKYVQKYHPETKKHPKLTTDRILKIFEERKLHQLVVTSCGSLFKSGHYSH